MFRARFFQAILILIPVCLLGWLFVQNFIPSGSFTAGRTVNQTSSFVDAFVPQERVLEIKKNAEGEWVQTLVADPVFFFVHPHRTFDTVEATIRFKNAGTPIVEFGALATKNPDRYMLEPLQNLIIDASSWTKILDGDMMLLQRKAVYTSVSDFLARPPARAEVATYHTDLTVPFRLPGYVASKSMQTLAVSLRGAQVMKTYAKNEPLEFVFTYSDMNRDAGADPVILSITDENGQHIFYEKREDDGVITSTGRSTGQKTLHVKTVIVPEGVYRIDLQVNRDIFVRSIQTPQQKLVFLNGVYLGDEVGFQDSFEPVTFFTESKRLSMQTRHAESVQNIAVGSGTLEIKAPYELTTLFVTDPGLVSGRVTKGDVEILSDAPMAFSPAQFFRPDATRLLPHTDLDQLKINYILAKYTPPTVMDGWSVATVSFDARSILLENGNWKFIFSLPEIAEFASSVDVREVSFEMKRAPMLWYQKLFGNKAP